MAKIRKLITIFLTLIVLCACQSAEENTNTLPDGNDEIQTISTEDDRAVMQYAETISGSEFEELSYETMYSIYTDSDFTGLIYIGRATCPYCQKAVEIYSDVAINENFHMYYLDSTKAKESEKFEEYDGFEFIKDENGDSLSQVPIVIALKKGKPVDSYIGVADDYNDSSKEPDNIQYDFLYKKIIEMYQEIKA